MGRIDGVLEKRFILESTATEGTRLFLEYGGRKFPSALAGIDGECFSLATGQRMEPRKDAQAYVLEIRFRGLVIRSRGFALSVDGRSVKLAFSDAWSTEGAASPRLRSVLPAISLSLEGERLEAFWPEAARSPDPAFTGEFPDSLSRLAFSMGLDAEYVPRGDPSRVSPVPALLSSQRRRIAVFGPPPTIPDALPEILADSAFLSRIELENLMGGWAGDGQDPMPPLAIGLHAPVFRASRCVGSLRATPMRSSFLGPTPGELLSFFLLESLASFSPLEGDGVLCAALQADGLCLWSPRASACSSLPLGTEAFTLVSYPGRSCGFKSVIRHRAVLDKGVLTIFDFTEGRPEDFRFVFERLSGRPLNGGFAEYFIKKAASEEAASFSG